MCATQKQGERTENMENGQTSISKVIEFTGPGKVAKVVERSEQGQQDQQIHIEKDKQGVDENIYEWSTFAPTKTGRSPTRYSTSLIYGQVQIAQPLKFSVLDISG